MTNLIYGHFLIASSRGLDGFEFGFIDGRNFWNPRALRRHLIFIIDET